MTTTTPRYGLGPALRLLSLALIATIATAAGAQTLQKTAVLIDGNGNGVFDVDETVQYTLVFTNTLTTDLSDVMVRDDSSSCINIDIATLVIDPPTGSVDNSSGNAIDVALRSPLPAGESVSLSFFATSTADGECCNQATWTATGSPAGVSDRNLSDPIPDQPTCHVTMAIVAPEYDAVVDKQVLTGGCLLPGSVVEFRISIRNSGQRPLRNGMFTDVLVPSFTNVAVDSGLTYDAASGRISSDSGTWGVGQETQYTYRATLPCTESGTLSNTGTFTFETNSGTVLRRSDTESVTWGQPDFVDSRKTWADDPTDGDSTVGVGENVRFTITVRNSGGCDAPGVTVSDALDPRFLSTTPPLVIDDGGIYDPLTGRIEWNGTTTPALALLSSGSSVQLGFTTQVDPATAPGQYIPNTVTIASSNGDSACPGVPPVTRTIALQNGNVGYGTVVPATVLLRNDVIACRTTGFETMRSVLRVRPEPQACSQPSAIDPLHPQTDTIIDPVSPYRFAGDGAWYFERCPDPVIGSGRVLIFYELQDDCTEMLRVTKDPANMNDVLVTW